MLLTARGRTRLALATAAGLAVVGVLPVGPHPRADAAEGTACEQVQQDGGDHEVEGANDPYERMQIGAAQEFLGRDGTDPGEGVDIYVVDTGLIPHDTLDPVLVQDLTDLDEFASGHGTAAAGIAAGPRSATRDGEPLPIGIAYEARLHDVRAYGEPRAAGTDDGDYPTSEKVAVALGEVLRSLRDRTDDPARNTVVLVPTAVDRSLGLVEAIEDLVDAGALVVAPAGNRPTSPDNPMLEAYYNEGEGIRPGEDAAPDVWPAGHPDVLTVGVAGEGDDDVTGSVLQNSQTDIAAPTAGGVSIALDGEPCVIEGYSSEYAAAQVAGVAALVWSAFPAYSARELRSLLLQTADGAGAPSPVTGHGVVQPLEALQRRFEPRRDGRPVVQPSSEDAGIRPKAPEDEADLLADTRSNAVWWGLVGGGALALALLLRPVLARRRR